jgi:tryptophan synthase beta chain
VLQGCKTYILQDSDGQIELTHSVSAGLDYAAIGPEHAFYRDTGRIEFAYATDDEVLEVFPALLAARGHHPGAGEHPRLVHGLKRAKALAPDKIVLINLSGRGDKDVQQVAKILGTQI